jgi:hypothetical protein
MVAWRIFAWKNICYIIFKNENTLKMIKMIIIFMKLVVVISHVISHNLNQICESFKKFDNFHVINNFLTIHIISMW